MDSWLKEEMAEMKYLINTPAAIFSKAEIERN
jgi:hypothetical protein